MIAIKPKVSIATLITIFIINVKLKKWNISTTLASYCFTPSLEFGFFDIRTIKNSFFIYEVELHSRNIISIFFGIISIKKYNKNFLQFFVFLEQGSCSQSISMIGFHVLHDKCVMLVRVNPMILGGTNLVPISSVLVIFFPILSNDYIVLVLVTPVNGHRFNLNTIP